MAGNSTIIIIQVQVRAQKAITTQLRGHPPRLPRPGATASRLRLRLTIPTLTEVHRLPLQAIRDMETQPPHLAVRSTAITSRPNLHINPEMTTAGPGTRTRIGGIRITANTQKARGRCPPYRLPAPPAPPPPLLSQHQPRPRPRLRLRLQPSQVFSRTIHQHLQGLH